jgi:hypothetical protein
MKSEKLFNILEGFDLELVNNPEFKEDSVREEIILPIIKGLGYSADKPFRIINYIIINNLDCYILLRKIDEYKLGKQKLHFEQIGRRTYKLIYDTEIIF